MNQSRQANGWKTLQLVVAADGREPAQCLCSKIIYKLMYATNELTLFKQIRQYTIEDTNEVYNKLKAARNPRKLHVILGGD